MRQGASVGYPSGRLAGHPRDSVVVVVIVKDRQILSLCGRGDDEVCWLGTSMVALLSQHLSNSKSPLHHNRCHRRLGKRPTTGSELAHICLASREHQLKINNSTGPDLACQLKLLKAVSHLFDRGAKEDRCVNEIARFVHAERGLRASSNASRSNSVCLRRRMCWTPEALSARACRPASTVALIVRSPHAVRALSRRSSSISTSRLVTGVVYMRFVRYIQHQLMRLRSSNPLDSVWHGPVLH